MLPVPSFSPQRATSPVWEAVIWSLIVLLFYAFCLHARSFLEWKMTRAAWLTVIGLAIVIVSFWGVGWFAPTIHPGP